MHHEQDMRKMGGLCKYMPITVSPADRHAGADRHAVLRRVSSRRTRSSRRCTTQRAGHTYAYWCVLLGVFVTAFYSFRLSS